MRPIGSATRVAASWAPEAFATVELPPPVLVPLLLRRQQQWHQEHHQLVLQRKQGRHLRWRQAEELLPPLAAG